MASHPFKHTACFVFLLVLLSLMCGSVLAQTSNRIDLVTTDASVAASERQAVLGISHLGLESNRLTFPVIYCALEQKCLPFGSWSVRLEQPAADELLADNISFLIPSRYDQMVFEGQTASFSTATQVFSDLPLGQNIPAFSTAPSSYRSYQQALLDYLNTHISPQMEQILSTAAEARYLEMNAQERGTFLREQARATGMPAAVLEGLISSSYAFGFYLPRMQGAITVRQVEKKRRDGSTYLAYVTRINLPANPRMLVFEYRNKAFQPFAELSPGSSARLSQSMTASAGVETLFLPSRRDAQGIFDRALSTAFRESVITLSNELKHYREFAVVTPVLSVRSSSAALKIGNQENIRIDQPFSFNRVINSREQMVGWGQVQQVGESCLALPQEQRSLSYARLVKGDVEEADLAVEYPWSGVFATLALTDTQTQLNLNGMETGAGGGVFFDFGFSGNLGYLRNNPSLSGWWLNMGLGIGAMDDPTHSSFQHIQGQGGVRFSLGMEKHWQLAQGFYSALGASLLAENYTYEDLQLDEQLSITSVNLLPTAELGYQFSPNSRLFVKAAYSQPLSSRGEYKDSGETDAELSGGAAVTLGFAMQLDFTGPYTWLMKKPSEQCNQLRNTISHPSY